MVHSTYANILENIYTKVSSLLDVDRDWSECKDRQLWVEIAAIDRASFMKQKIINYDIPDHTVNSIFVSLCSMYS